MNRKCKYLLIFLAVLWSYQAYGLTCNPGQEATPGNAQPGDNKFKVWACYPNGFPNPPENICLCRHSGEGAGGMKWLNPPKYVAPLANGTCPSVGAGYTCTLSSIGSMNNLCAYVKALWFEKHTAKSCPNGYKVRDISDPVKKENDPNHSPPNKCCSYTYSWKCVKSDVNQFSVMSTTQTDVVLSWLSDEGITRSVVAWDIGTVPPADCMDGVDVGSDLMIEIQDLLPDTDYSFRVCGIFEDEWMSEGETITEHTLP